MEGPISKFIHVQQPETYWPNSTPFKSPDLIELNSDSEKNVKPAVEPLNYSSSQEEVETEDDCNDAPESSILGKEGIPGVYDVTSNDEESCHLLQTEDSENSDSEHEHEHETSYRSSASRSSSSDAGTNSEGDGHEQSKSCEHTQSCIYEITSEQLDYYTEQFYSLQPDAHGLIHGQIAKPYFEKSKLPVEDLRNIWQLADTTEDGCLDLFEFQTAMHFVVLRKHGFPIPTDFNQIAQSKDPETRNRNPELKKLYKLLNRPRGSITNSGLSLSQVPSAPSGSNATTIASGVMTHAEPPQLPPIVNRSTPPGPSVPTLSNSTNHAVLPAAQPKVPVPPGKGNLRTIQKSSKEEWTTFDNEPVNFSSTCDTSGLVAPVPVRLTTPEDNALITTNSNGAGPASASKVQQLQLKAIQRPKLSGHHPKVSASTIAPPPPPRRKTHVRSSSLDLNRLTISSDLQSGNLNGPEVPARSFLSPTHQGGAFSIYRKPQVPKAATIHEPRSDLNDFRQFRNSIENTVGHLRREVSELRSDNVILTRITAQLLDQLSGLQTKRQNLTFQLHQFAADSTRPGLAPQSSNVQARPS